MYHQRPSETTKETPPVNDLQLSALRLAAARVHDISPRHNFRPLKNSPYNAAIGLTLQR